MSAINVASRPRMWTGIVVALAAAAGFSLANTSASLAYQGGTTPLTIAATRFIVPAVALVIWMRLGGVSPRLPRRDAFVATALGAVTALYTWALLRSFGSIPFAVAVLIFYLFPLLAAVIVAAFGWEKFAWRTGGAIVLAIVGLALALDIRGGHLNLEGVTLAFLAAVGLAIVVAFSSRLLRAGDARPVTLYMAVGASVLLLIICAASGDFALPQTAPAWIGFFAAAAFYGFAMIAFFIAISMIGPVRASLLSYADAVISAGLGVVVLGQALTLVQVAGIAIVIVALIGATLAR
jgi:drug/metabolite transporter (DMT)-like permease